MNGFWVFCPCALAFAPLALAFGATVIAALTNWILGLSREPDRSS
jgi:hypothetical protein